MRFFHPLKKEGIFRSQDARTVVNFAIGRPPDGVKSAAAVLQVVVDSF